MGLSATAQTKAMYNFVVPKDGTFREAIAAANNRKDKDARFRIFVLQGEYEIPTEGKTVGGDGRQYDDPRMFLKAPNTSIIGEDRDNTIITNKVPFATWDNGFGKANPLEGIGNGDVLVIEKKCNNTYLQDITMKNTMDDATGRNIVLHNCADKTIAKNICMWGYQDSYVSDNQTSRYSFEGGVMSGRHDYICGKGDVV
jgi:pectin methylesterase-like acyl-CoA thioesterase